MQLQCGLQADVANSSTKIWPSCQKVKVLPMSGNDSDYYIHRNTVQMLMSLIDLQGAKRRKGCRLKRRVYQNKVNVHKLNYPTYFGVTGARLCMAP